MALTPAQELELDSIVREAKAVKRRASLLVQHVARLRDEVAAETEQTEEVTSNAGQAKPD